MRKKTKKPLELWQQVLEDLRAAALRVRGTGFQQAKVASELAALSRHDGREFGNFVCLSQGDDAKMDALRELLAIVMAMQQARKDTIVGTLEQERAKLHSANKRRGEHNKTDMEMCRKVVDVEASGRSIAQTADDLRIALRMVSKYRSAATRFGIPRPGRKKKPASS
jgi:hypothetical protein